MRPARDMKWRNLLRAQLEICAAVWLLIMAVPMQSAGAADFAEANAGSWGTFASDGAARSVSDDSTHVKAGSFSVRFDTTSGFDTGVKYPGSGAAHWNLTTNTHFSFWHF